jgi:hypothetical protein
MTVIDPLRVINSKSKNFILSVAVLPRAPVASQWRQTLATSGCSSLPEHRSPKAPDRNCVIEVLCLVRPTSLSPAGQPGRDLLFTMTSPHGSVWLSYSLRVESEHRFTKIKLHTN